MLVSRHNQRDLQSQIVRVLQILDLVKLQNNKLELYLTICSINGKFDLLISQYIECIKYKLLHFIGAVLCYSNVDSY